MKDISQFAVITAKAVSKMQFIAMLLVILIAFTGCNANKRTGLIEDQSGMFGKKIRITTQPTKAKIFINERELGESPLTYEISHSESRMLNIKAVPLYPNQYTQNIFLMVPPLPQNMTIYMNHIPENYDRTVDKPFTPPAKPEPVVITQVERDTVYIENIQKTDTLIPTPEIYFDTALFNIKPEFEDELQTFITALKHNQEFSVEIYGYADKRNSADYNRTLSLNRAKAVKEYLVNNGIKDTRLTIYGSGITKTTDEHGAEVDLQVNRKVIFILKK